MPIYEYLCNSCGLKKEHLQKMSDAPIKVCPTCGSESYAKLVSAAGFQLKGSGWYVTDFKNKPAPASAKQSDKDSAQAADVKAASTDAADSSKTESKSGSKTDSGSATTSSGSVSNESSGSSGAAKSKASTVKAD